LFFFLYIGEKTLKSFVKKTLICFLKKKKNCTTSYSQNSGSQFWMILNLQHGTSIRWWIYSGVT